MSLHYQLALSGGKLIFKDTATLGMTEAGELDDFCYCCSCPPTNDCKYPDGSAQQCANGKNIALPEFLLVSLSGITVQSCITNFPDWASLNAGCSCPRASGAGTCGISWQWENTTVAFSGTPNPLNDAPCNYVVKQPKTTPGTIAMSLGDKCCTIQDEGFAAVGWEWYAQYNASTQTITVIVVAKDNGETVTAGVTVIPCFFAGTASIPCGTWKPGTVITIPNGLSVGQEITSGYIFAGGGVELWGMASGGTCTLQCLMTDPGTYV